MYRLLTEEQAQKLMEEATQKLECEQAERERHGIHDYQHLIGLAERRMSHCAVFVKKEAE